MSKGPNRKPERPALAEAVRAAGLRKGPPGPEDVPPPSLFPMTPAARAAIELRRGERTA